MAALGACIAAGSTRPTIIIPVGGSSVFDKLTGGFSSEQQLITGSLRDSFDRNCDRSHR